jgi:hypothetical protein
MEKGERKKGNGKRGWKKGMEKGDGKRETEKGEINKIWILFIYFLLDFYKDK